jgi:4-amino-4-deoxy-L-arabinose transferase-like glycosyltransferase
MIAVGLILSVGGGLGTLVMKENHLSIISKQVIRVSLGVGLLGLIFFGISLINLSAWTAWGFLLLAAALFWRGVLEWWRDWSAIIPLVRANGMLGVFVGGCALILVLCALMVALAPPLRFDSLVYHLLLPRIYVNADRFIYTGETFFWGFPQLTHILYAWMLALGAKRMAVLTWGLGIMTLIGVLDYTRYRLGNRAAWAGLATILAGFSVAASLAWGYMDWSGMLFGLGVLIGLDQWREAGDVKWLRLAGIFTGLAFGTKYTAGILLIGSGVVLIWEFWRTKRSVGLVWLNFLVPAGLLALPWLLKNVIATGNPFYPLLFPAGAVDSTRLSLFQNKPIQGNWLDAVFLPIRATFWGIELGTVGNAPNFEISIGPLFIGLGIWVGLDWKKRLEKEKKLISTATLLALSGLLIWAIGGRLSGYLIRTHLYFSLFPAFAIMAGAGFQNIERSSLPGIRLGRIAAVLLILVLGLNALEIGLDMFRKGAPRYFLAMMSEDDYVTQNLGVYYQAMEEIRSMDQEARVLMLWETRGYYCFPGCDSDEVIDRWPSDWERFGDRELVLADWQAQGYTHLLYAHVAADFMKSHPEKFEVLAWNELDALVAELSVLEKFGEAYTLYDIKP